MSITAPALGHAGGETPWPDTTTGLDPAERMILWGLRCWLLGLRRNDGAPLAAIWNDFARRLGTADGKAALSAFVRMIKTLQGQARRPIRHHQPCCPCLGPDEAALIALVAACQERRMGVARGLAETLVAADGADPLIVAGSRLAQLLGHHLPPFRRRTAPDSVAPIPPWPDPESATLH